MPESTEPSATVTRRDLQLLTTAAMIRLPIRAAEHLRLRQLDELRQTRGELCRAIAEHTRRAMVNARGSHGTDCLDTEVTALFVTHTRYATLVREIAAEYERFADVAATSSGASVESVPPSSLAMAQMGIA